jgi:uncharacterized protein (DUF2141 family)
LKKAYEQFDIRLLNQKQMYMMNKQFFLLFLLSVIPLTSFSQFAITIEINDLRNCNGQILLEFTNDKGEKISGIAQKIVDNKCMIVLNNLNPGKYAFKYFHDENKNEKLDVKWMGIPKEGYGFSNNAKGTFGPPQFDKTIFEIKENTVIKCVTKYF